MLRGNMGSSAAISTLSGGGDFVVGWSLKFVVSWRTTHGRTAGVLFVRVFRVHPPQHHRKMRWLYE